MRLRPEPELIAPPYPAFQVEVDGGASSATAGSGDEKSTVTGVRSAASVISKNSRGSKCPTPAISELGNT